MRLAAVDCGTNTLRLLIVEVDAAGAVHDVLRTASTVRLGQGVDRTGVLAPEALARADVVLADYRSQLDQYRVDKVRMVATSATRDASNAAEFTALVRKTLGVEPEVISGSQEARLSYRGAVAGLGAGPFLVIDIGGGSTELIAGAGIDDIAASVSLDIGAVRITERFLAGDPPTADELAGAGDAIAGAVAQAGPVISAHSRPTVVGVAGTVLTVAALAMGASSYQPTMTHGYKLTTENVGVWATKLAAASRQQRAQYSVIEPGRVDIIAAGALILHHILVAADASVIRASEHDILDGIIESMR